MEQVNQQQTTLDGSTYVRHTFCPNCRFRVKCTEVPRLLQEENNFPFCCLCFMEECTEYPKSEWIASDMLCNDYSGYNEL